ncbi:spore coat protein [Pelotomaculum terephthalicicum JT]|uniref:spore coat protein n=1 Tax=Pelotomaculum terephthalicicum TaxID=206393 RepID=UPI001F038C18|nr:spore coat protein [Pelotomaculum terephthalicicum]MCG9968035.1 spore coat protein [Pelotomaculum terephthalicicum JT]
MAENAVFLLTVHKAMQRYQVPLPPRQPKGTDFSVNMDIARDQGMFRIILSMTQTALSLHTKAINICTNNFLRNMFTDFLNEEIEIYNLLLEYGESKNWVYSAPNYSNSST